MNSSVGNALYYNSDRMEIFDNVSRIQGSEEWSEVTEDEIPSVVNRLTELWPESLIGVYRRAVIFSSSKNYSGIESILEGNSNLINWNDGSILFCVVSLDFSKRLQDLCPSISKRVVFCGGICDCYWMPTEVAKALNVECPDEMYFSALEDCHTDIVNSTWAYGSSETYDMVRDIIKFMDTIGLFTKRDSKLVSWALNAVYGIGLLYTIEEYRNNGYGTLVVKKLANILGTTNRNPFLVTLQSNSIAKSVIGKCGFISLEPAEFMKMMQYLDNV
ncbi:hypothetical protein J437_LFUL004327 [Ladona fulva]|uniref:GCN5-related N-acetyltransferase Rv2170-like domain-containing protein n=1 Tax=Ladona fulva TaxID=123851 RepID=A0A8K0P071_LADFU|nr:hypothetical protein J437_LFUL004327 [Ladona fulva]